MSHKERFNTWADKVKVPAKIRGKLEKALHQVNPEDLDILLATKQVKTVKQKGIMGCAYLHSKVIQLNTDSLSSVGGQPEWYMAVSLHEAVHAVLGLLEHEATHIEQGYAGTIHSQGRTNVKKSKMRMAMHMATTAQIQREFDVKHKQRVRDFNFLSDSGFTTKSARRVVSTAKSTSKRIREARAASASNKHDGTFKGIFLNQSKDLYLLDDVALEAVYKTVDAEIGEILGGCIEKSLESSSGLPLDVIERFVRLSVKRGECYELRGPQGIVPALRRAKGSVHGLPADKLTQRNDDVSSLLEILPDQGLFNDDGTPTDVHLRLILNGYSPVEPDQLVGRDEHGKEVNSKDTK
jgi:hypothetical protein